MSTDRLTRLMLRTEYRLRYLAEAALDRHRDAADAGKPFSAWGAWIAYSRYFYRAQDLQKFLNNRKGNDAQTSTC